MGPLGKALLLGLACWALTLTVSEVSGLQLRLEGQEALAAEAQCGAACGCQPWCHWKCKDPVCNTTCRPVCLKPKCHVACEPIQCHKCTAKCQDAPKCRILCPKLGCQGGQCPQCRHECEPAKQCAHNCAEPEKPRCVPQCETKCWSKCESKCPGGVNRPQCEMVCGFPDCPSHCRSHMPTTCHKKGHAPPKCCSCSQKQNTGAAISMANANCNSSACASGAKPSFLEVMSSLSSEAKCCPCADKAALAASAAARRKAQQAAQEIADKQAQQAQLQKVEQMAAYGEKEAQKEQEMALKKVLHTPFYSSYTELAGANQAASGFFMNAPGSLDEGLNTKTPKYPGYPSPMGQH